MITQLNISQLKLVSFLEGLQFFLSENSSVHVYEKGYSASKCPGVKKEISTIINLYRAICRAVGQGVSDFSDTQDGKSYSLQEAQKELEAIADGEIFLQERYAKDKILVSYRFSKGEISIAEDMDINFFVAAMTFYIELNIKIICDRYILQKKEERLPQEWIDFYH